MEKHRAYELALLGRSGNEHSMVGVLVTILTVDSSHNVSVKVKFYSISKFGEW